jgi:hypothetical protein
MATFESVGAIEEPIEERDRQGAILSIAWNISDNLRPDEWTDPGSGDPAWLFEGAVSPKPVTDAALTIPPATAAVQRTAATGGPPTTGGPAGSKRNTCAGPTPETVG